MRKLVLGISSAVLIIGAGLVAAQVQETPEIAAAATQPDPGAGMRLASMDTSVSAFHKLDEDNDGRISALEAANNPTVAAAFTTADKDKDGYLSKEEFAAMNPASANAKQDLSSTGPAGDRASNPNGDNASYPSGDRASYPSGDRVSNPSGDTVSNPSGDQPATGPNDPTPTDNSTSPRRIAHPRK